MNNIGKLLVVTIMMSCSISGCKKKEKACTDIPVTVSFSKDVMAVFNANCNTSGCHSGSAPAGGLNLEPSKAYAELINPRSGYIDAGNPTSSLLYSSMNSISKPMPPTGKLDKCTIELVLTWIQQGAKNN